MIATSGDGQWAAVRRGREVALLAGGAGAPVGMLALDGDDVDLALVGPPEVLVAVARDGQPRVTLHQPPYLDAVARLDLAEPMRLAATTGPRFALVSTDGKQVTIVRVAGRALSQQAIDPGSPVEFAVGLERNQLLLGLLRKLEVWDAVSGRTLLRLQLQLPPPPRTVGAAQGHLWVTRPGTDEIYVYRLSDGRQFRHYAGAPVEAVVCHPASPLIVLVTRAGLMRLHCFAHAMTTLDVPWAPGTSLAQLVTGEDIALLGLAPGGGLVEPWRAPIAGAGAPPFDAAVAALADPEATPVPGPAPLPPPALAPVAAPAPAPAAAVFPPVAAPTAFPAPAFPAASAASAAFPAAAPIPPAAPVPVLELPRPAPVAARLELSRAQPPAPLARPASARSRAWREPLAVLGAELARGGDAELPVVAVDNELGELAHRLRLSATARRTLIALYALHLAGEPRAAIGRLAKLTGDWGEPLGQGELTALAMLRRRDGRVALRRPVADLLDGAPPREVRLIEPPAPGGGDAPRAGAFRIARDGRGDAALEAELAALLGRIAVVEGDPDRALLEARLHDATALALQPLPRRPRPWPRDAGLVLVPHGTPASWIADLPSLAGPTA